MKNKNLFSYLFANKAWLFTTCVLVIFASTLAELIPFLQGRLVSQGVIAQSEAALTGILIAVGVALVLDTAARDILWLSTNRTGFAIAKNLRTDFFARLMRQPYTFFVQRRSGDMVFRSNIFIYSIAGFLSKNLADIAIGLSRALIIFVYIFVLNSFLALVLFGLYLVAILFAVIHSRQTLRLGKAYKHLELHRNALILQNLDNMETYLAYNDDFSYLPHYKRIDSTYHKIRGRFHLSKHWFYPCLDFFVSLGTVLIYELTFSFGLDVIEVGVLVALLTYSTRLIAPIQLIADGLAEMFTTSATVSKIFGFLQKPFHLRKTDFKHKTFDINCTNVCHTDPATGAHFENLSLSIPHGTHVAITGTYGNGKTAFAELLLGLNQPLSGSVCFNNTPVAAIRKTSLHKLISVAEDEVAIFDDTLFENVHFALPSAPAKKVASAITQAGLMPFANRLPKGIHSRISSKNISEGTKQLIAFARLILKNTPVIIIDEFERDLDPKMAKTFQKSLKTFAHGKTLIYICQTTPDTLKFDQIINFDNKK